MYAYVVFSNLPFYLSDTIEKMLKCAPQIIFPMLSYTEALTVNDLQSPQNRRIMACKRPITSLKPDNPVYKLVSSRTVGTQYNNALRPKELKKLKYPWHFDHQV